MIDPNKIVIMRDGGTADMGSLAFNPTDTEAQFFIEDGSAFAPVFIRVHFAGGTGTADVRLNVDSRNESQFDTVLFTFNERGIASTGLAADINYRLPEEQLVHWLFQPGDKMTLTWTNPDTGNMSWGAEVGLIRMSDIAVG